MRLAFRCPLFWGDGEQASAPDRCCEATPSFRLQVSLTELSMSRINFFIRRRWRIRSIHWPGIAIKAAR